MASSFSNGKRNLADTITFLQSLGAVEIVWQRGKHYKISAVRDGKKITAVMSVTPSDRRSHLNTICQIKRQVRAADATK